MQLFIKKLDPAAVVPTYGSDGAGCFDLYALDDGAFHPADVHATIYRTGLAFQIPPGWVMAIFSRSGHGFNNAIRLSNCVGIIDSDYRGEVMVSLRFDGADRVQRSKKIRAGDRMAQAMLTRVDRVNFEVVEELAATRRGTGGFGSTGA